MQRLFGVFAFVWACLWVAPVLAAGLEASVAIDETTAVVGDVITAEFTVARSDRGELPTPELPASVSEAFDVGQCSVTQSRSAFFGSRGSSSRRLACPLTAKKAGTFSIAFSVPDGKKRVSSNSVKVEVTAEAAERGPLEDPTVEAPPDATEDVFMWVSVDKMRAYVGEQVSFRLDVYEARRFVEVSLATTPSFESFTAQDQPLPEVYTTTVGERAFRVRPGVRKALFPQVAGKATIGSAEMLINRRKRRSSDTVELEILPLPADGQPAGFSPSNVGRYQVAASVDRDEVQPGEPFTLTYTVKGAGNIDVFDPGAFAELPGVRRYDPKTSTKRSGGTVVGGQRTYAFLVIPERPGTLEIPAHTISFFDPEAEAYATAASKPVTVVVGGDPTAIVKNEADEGSTAEGTAIDEPLAPVVAVDAVPRLVPRDRWLTQERWTTGMLAIPMLVLAGLAGGWAWRRFGPDDAARALTKARARRRAHIEVAQDAVETGEGFHAAIATLLQDVALDRAGPGGTGLPRPELVRLLERKGVSTDDRRRLESLLERCDAARFGAVSGDASDRNTMLDEALSTVRGLAKERS
ncbi:MAG: BatD family protein [Myxococcota bacterium]